MNFINDPSLVLYLPLYERDGGSLVSRDAYGHLSSVSGALWRPYGRYFDKTDDRVDCGNQSALAITKGITLEAWFRTNDYFGTVDLLGKGVGQYNLRFSYQGNGIFSLGLVIGGTQRWPINFNGQPYCDDVWHHIVGTYGNDISRLFLDGELKKEDSSYPGDLTTNSSHFYLGTASGSSAWFGGNIGEVRVYNRALTPPEVQRNYLVTKWRYR